MAKQTINIGTSANDGTGSTLREAFDITNDNFTELYDGTGGLLHKIEGTNFTGSLLIGHSTTGTLNDAQGNVGIGIGALDALTSADNNIAIGRNAGTALTSGVGNVAIGHEALFTEDTTGANVAIGFRALKNQNSNSNAFNVAVGYNAGKSITTGVNNVIVGGNAGDALTEGDNNVAIGKSALSAEDGNGNNVAVGYQALQVLNAGNSGNNVAVGREAGKVVSTGIKNTILGSKAGDLLETGENNIIIGYNAEASSTSVNNEITFGDSNITNVRIPSDSTLKIGADGDLQIEHVSSNSFIKNTAIGDLYIQNEVDDKDIIFRADNGSGGLMTYFSLDGSDARINVNAGNGMQFMDDVKAKFGTSGDLTIHHNGTNSFIKNVTNNLIIENTVDDANIQFKCDDGSGGTVEYFRVDGSNEHVVYSKSVIISDSVSLKFGDGSDLIIQHNQGASLNQIDNNNFDLYIQQNAADKDIIFRSDDGSGGLATYFTIDGGVERNIFSKDTEHGDSVSAYFGSSNDFRILHNGSHTFLTQNGTGDLRIVNAVSDGDIKFQGDDGTGSGSVTTYFRVDGGSETIVVSKPLNLIDSTGLKLGSGGNDFSAYHNGSNTFLDNNTGNLNIRNTADDADIIFVSDDGSGGVSEYFRVDGGSTDVRFSKNTRHLDNVRAEFGSSGNFVIKHDGDDTLLQCGSSGGNLTLMVAEDDHDMIFQCDDGSGGITEYFRLDGGDVKILVSKDINIIDGEVLKIGTGEDLQMFHNGTNSFINNFVGDLEITQNTDDGDIIFKNDDGSGSTTEYFRFDGSSVQSIISKPFRFLDNVQAIFGTGNDLQIYHNGTNSHIDNNVGNLNIRQFLDDGDITFNCDDGSGGVTEYFRLDGGLGYSVSSQHIQMADGKAVYYGNGNDLGIYHLSNNSFIENLTGDLTIRTSTDDGDIKFECDDGSGGTTEYFKIDGQFEVNKFSKNVQFLDNVSAMFGNGADLTISSNGSSGLINNLQGNLTIQTSTDDGDIVFKSDDGSGGLATYFQLDGSDLVTLFSKATRHTDDVKAQFGNSGDLLIFHDGTDSQIKNSNGDLKIEVSADDKDIVFRNDDGSGAITTYVQLDGSEVSTKILTQKVIMSNLPTSDPNNAGQLYNDSGVLKVSAG